MITPPKPSAVHLMDTPSLISLRLETRHSLHSVSLRHSYTISTLIPVESAGSFGDGRCCHSSGYLQIALGLPPSPSPNSLRQFHQTNHGNGITCSFHRRFHPFHRGSQSLKKPLAAGSENHDVGHRAVPGRVDDVFHEGLEVCPLGELDVVAGLDDLSA